MISIDTELMKQLVAGCETANDAIEDAVANLTGITSHNDWGCREKTTIDDYTNTNKQKVKELQECSTNFLRALKAVAVDFEEAESQLAEMVADVDAIIGDTIGIAPAAEESTRTVSSILESVLGKVGIGVALAPMGTATLGSYVAKTINKAISVCNFNDIKL